MNGLDPFDDDSEGTVFRDVIMLALLGFVVVAVLMLPHLNPPEAQASARPPGNVVVEVRWPDGMNADVDLWVAAPGDKPVGYSNKGGRVFNLLRDDLGRVNDSTPLNYEVAYSRGMPEGEYAVNLHLYRNDSGIAPIECTVEVSLQKTLDRPPVRVATRQVQLRHLGQETTVLRFSLDKNGDVVHDSLHDLPRPLRGTARR